MKVFGIAALSLALSGSMSAATADPWKDESGKGRERGGYSGFDGSYPGRGFGYGPRYGEYGGRERKVEYDDGRCKVERKWGKHGDYKEEVKCRGGSRGGYPAYGFRD